MIYLDLYEVGFFEIFKGIILPLCLVFFFELLYSQALLDISKQTVPEMQEDLEDNEELLAFFEAVVALGSPRALLALITGAFVLMDKASSLYLWSVTLATYFIANSLESLYAEQRLYLLTGEVKTPLCFTGFGNPSDEVALNFFIHTTLFLHAADRDEFRLRVVLDLIVDFERVGLMRKSIHCLWPILLLVYLSLFMFAMVLLGANSFN